MSETQTEYLVFSLHEINPLDMPTPQDHKEARRLAVRALKTRNIAECCRNAHVDLRKISEKEQQASIPFLGNPYVLSFSDEQISFETGDSPLSIADQVLLLHYLAEATGAPLENRWISFREVPSGTFYYPSFLKRAVTPLVNTLGRQPEALKQTAQTLGETLRAPGDTALKIDALPRIPVLLCLWKGDDEFPVQGNVFFDASISFYLGTEDIAYIAGATVYRVLNIAKRFL
jgi:hypothetical protein